MHIPQKAFESAWVRGNGRLAVQLVVALMLALTRDFDNRSFAATAPVGPVVASTIRSIAVRIVTQDFHSAGTPSDVWLDLGVQAWQLRKHVVGPGAPFHRAATDMFLLCGPPTGCAPYTSDDLFEIRLEKKGIGGFTGAEDGVDGGWMPKEISLIVDDILIAGPIRVLPDRAELDKRRPAWRHLLKANLNANDRFLLGLRATPNSRPSTHLDEVLSGLTTIFKRAGISGWQPGPLPTDPEISATVEGLLYAPPSPGTDGFVSLDLNLERVFVGGSWAIVNSPEGLAHPRYLRVEYIHGPDTRYKQWKVGQRFRVTGQVKWDTDRDGFFEIHAIGANNISEGRK